MLCAFVCVHIYQMNHDKESPHKIVNKYKNDVNRIYSLMPKIYPFDIFHLIKGKISQVTNIHATCKLYM